VGKVILITTGGSDSPYDLKAGKLPNREMENNYYSDEWREGGRSSLSIYTVNVLVQC